MCFHPPPMHLRVIQVLLLRSLCQHQHQHQHTAAAAAAAAAAAHTSTTASSSNTTWAAPLALNGSATPIHWMRPIT